MTALANDSTTLPSLSQSKLARSLTEELASEQDPNPQQAFKKIFVFKKILTRPLEFFGSRNQESNFAKEEQAKILDPVSPIEKTGSQEVLNNHIPKMHHGR